MNWDWVIRQLQGERLEIPKGGGRRVINIGLGHYQRELENKPDVRAAIVQALQNGPMTTPDLYEHLAADGTVTTPDALMHHCKRMLKRGQILMKKEHRRLGGKGLCVWSVGEIHESKLDTDAD